MTLGGEDILLAAWRGNVDQVQALISGGTDVNLCQDGFTALHLAVWNLHKVVIELLLRVPTINPSTSNLSGYTSLHYAVWNNDVNTIGALLKACAKVSAEDGEGKTPIIWAASSGRTEVVKILLEAGAEVSPRGRARLAAIYFAKSSSILQTLIEGGADIEARDSKRCTPLHIAALYRQFHAVMTLVEGGADGFTRNGQGLKPFDPLMGGEKLLQAVIARLEEIDEEYERDYY